MSSRPDSLACSVGPPCLKRKSRAVAQLVGCLPSMHRALGLNLRSSCTRVRDKSAKSVKKNKAGLPFHAVRKN